MWNLFEKFRKQREDAYNLHISPEVQALLDAKTPLTLEKWKSLRINSFERYRLYPLLDDEAFVATVRYYVGQCHAQLTKFQVPETYNDALLGYMVLELCRRMERKEIQPNVARNVEESILSC